MIRPKPLAVLLFVNINGGDQMKCPTCNKKMDCKTGKYQYSESGLDNVYLLGVEVCKCSCGERSVSIPAIMELHRVIGIALVTKDTALTGKEIKFLRKNIGISGKVFAEVIGIDRSTLSRWENDNQVVSKSNDRLIRLVYLNFKGIAHKKIKNQIRDKFKEIKHEKKKSFRFTIPVKDWVPGPNMCEI